MRRPATKTKDPKLLHDSTTVETRKLQRRFTTALR